MVVNRQIGSLVLGVLMLSILVQSPPSSPIVCSTFCNINGCSGWGMNQCNGNCYSGWTPTGTTCDFTVASRQAIMDYSNDAGGGIQLVPDPMSSTCSFDTGATPHYGDLQAGTTYSLVLLGGTYIAHYAFDVYANIVLVQRSGSAWDNNFDFDARFTTTSQTESVSINNGGGGGGGSGSRVDTSDADLCGTGSKEYYYRLVYNNFYHNTTGDTITVQLSNSNSGANAVWNARQFIFVAKLCNIYCLTCFNATIDDCYQCDVAAGYMLSNTTCATSCLPGYGNTSDPGVCVLCDIRCIVCYQVGDNCSSCNQTSPSTGYLFDNTTVGYTQCVNPCPDGYFQNTTARTCDLCDGNCTECNLNSTYCYACQPGFSWYNYKCLSPCITGLYQYFNNSTNSSNCSQCPNVCLSCTNFTVCTACTLSGSNEAYLLNNTCYPNCPAGYFEEDYGGPGPNLCIGCTTLCATCTGNPTPCQSCNAGFYLYGDACQTTCPTGYFTYDPWWRCLDCPTYCVDLTISMIFSDSTNKKLYIDMQFSRDLNFTTFDYQNFQSLSISNQDISNFNTYYSITSSSAYRITLEPKGYIFIYNETVTVTTMEEPSILHYSSDSMPFKTTNYQKTAQKNWFLMNSPSMTDTEQAITNGLSGFNDAFASATATPFLAEVKKAGVLALLFSGAQITSTTVMINSVPPQNMYEGVRFWAVSVFYDVPAWQQTSSHPNHFFTSQMHNLTLNQRRLFDLNNLYWRFQRTGMTTFFIYDVYIPLLLISVVWFLALLAKILKSCKGYNFKSYEAKYFAVLHKLHELVILYVTFAMMLEWIYFDAASTERWISLIICLAFTCYFVGYHLYIYYDMISYPEAMIGNDKYEYYVRRYSTFLKNLRYEQYDMKEEWSPKHFFRPYNYHILSYYKKFCLIISLPLFYDSKNWQAGVLIIIQGLELTRFLLTKPYYATWRNVYRFCMELALLLFFMVIFILGFIMDEIVKNDPNTLQKYIKVYYNLGWLGFALVWIFNLGFIVLTIVDIVQGCKKNNRQLMDEARRIYYYNKITEYEKDSDQVPLGLMNKWVKLGNLNDRDHQQLPNINVRIEYYKLIKHGDYFDVDLLKIVELFMNTDFNYHQENNTTPGKKIKKRIKLSKEVSSSLYGIVSELYSKHAKKGTEAIVIKTFINVEQKDFKAGDRIPLLPEHMLQKIEIENYQGEKETIKLSKLIKGFPINAFDLQSI